MRSSGNPSNETQSNRNSAATANFQRSSNCRPPARDRELAMVSSIVVRPVRLRRGFFDRLGDSGVSGVAGFCSFAKRGESPMTPPARSEWTSLDAVVLRDSVLLERILCRCPIHVWNGDSRRVSEMNAAPSTESVSWRSMRPSESAPSAPGNPRSWHDDGCEVLVSRALRN